MEARLRAILETAVDGIILTDVAGTVLIFNPACERLFGYGAGEIVGRNVKALMPGPFHDEHDKYLENYRRTGERKMIGIGREVVGRRKDGSTFPINLSIGETTQDSERLFVGIIHDITDRKRTVETLRESAAQLSAVVRTAVDGVILVDAQGTVMMFNPACERLFGYSQSEMIGRNVKALIPDPFHDEHDKYLENYRRTGERKIIGIGREVVGQRKDGTTFPIDLSVGETRQKGKPFFVGIIRDSTDRKVTEEALRESAQQFSAVVNTAVDGVILIDAHGTVRMFNPACEALFGYGADEVVGQNVKLLMPPPFHEEHDQYLNNYRSTGERKIIGIGREVVGQRKDGSTFPMDLSVGETRQKGEPLFVGIIRDITSRKRDEAQRERLIEQLAASNEERGYFAHVAAHDLEQSLRMVTSFNGILLNRYADCLDERGREFLSLSVSASERMRTLLEDVAEFGRVGTDPERAAWFEPADCVRQAVENLREAFKDSGAIVTQDTLPKVYGNPVRFTRVVQNLVGNGIKYVAPGTVPQIHVSCQTHPHEWVFRVADNGIGIDPQYQARIFEPLKRLHTADEYSGTGMGLAICKRIVEGLGGQISVDSTPGAGATFSFSIRIPAARIAHG